MKEIKEIINNSITIRLRRTHRKTRPYARRNTADKTLKPVGAAQTERVFVEPNNEIRIFYKTTDGRIKRFFFFL